MNYKLSLSPAVVSGAIFTTLLFLPSLASSQSSFFKGKTIKVRRISPLDK